MHTHKYTYKTHTKHNKKDKYTNRIEIKHIETYTHTTHKIKVNI